MKTIAIAILFFAIAVRADDFIRVAQCEQPGSALWLYFFQDSANRITGAELRYQLESVVNGRVRHYSNIRLTGEWESFSKNGEKLTILLRDADLTTTDHLTLKADNARIVLTPWSRKDIAFYASIPSAQTFIIGSSVFGCRFAQDFPVSRPEGASAQTPVRDWFYDLRQLVPLTFDAPLS